MRLADLWRHASFRYAVALSFSILTVLMLAGGIGFGLMHAQLTARQNSRIQEVFAALQPALQNDDQPDLIEAVKARIAASPDRASVFQLRDAAGSILSANMTDIRAVPGWSYVDAAQLGIRSDYPYRLFTGTVGPYTLTVGQSDGDLDDFREIIANSLLWAALAVLAGAMITGAVLARRMQARVTLVAAAMQQVAAGDLSARLPVSGRADDVDTISVLINTALARLAQVVEAMRTVTEDIAHDLRTPLTRLRNRIEELSQKSAAGQLVTPDLDLALAECDQINQTFSALLRIAQINAGDRRAGFRRVDLGAILADLAEVYAPVAEDAGLRFDWSPQPHAEIFGDPELLTQMIVNLIENVIQHCRAGARLTCAVTAIPGAVRLHIADTGPGIAVEQRDAVFRRLYRIETSRTTPGSGLGLSLVQAIVHLHDADIALTDTGPAQGATPASGLTVTVTFPAP